MYNNFRNRDCGCSETEVKLNADEIAEVEIDVDMPLIDESILDGSEGTEEDSKCPPVILTDCCDEVSKDIPFKACEIIKNETINDISLKCLGRLLKVTINLNNVCKGKEIALGVIICDGNLIKGFRTCTVTVPVPGNTDCIPFINVDEFCFVLPEKGICLPKSYTVKVIAHYTNIGTWPCTN